MLDQHTTPKLYPQPYSGLFDPRGPATGTAPATRQKRMRGAAIPSHGSLRKMVSFDSVFCVLVPLISTSLKEFISKDLFFLFHVCECFVYTYVSAPHVSSAARDPNTSDQLLAAMWVLRTTRAFSLQCSPLLF